MKRRATGHWCSFLMGMCEVSLNDQGTGPNSDLTAKKMPEGKAKRARKRLKPQLR